MKSKIKKLAAVAAALTMTASLGGCSVAAQNEPDGEQTDITEQLPDTELDGTRPPEVEAEMRRRGELYIKVSLII